MSVIQPTVRGSSIEQKIEVVTPNGDIVTVIIQPKQGHEIPDEDRKLKKIELDPKRFRIVGGELDKSHGIGNVCDDNDDIESRFSVKNSSKLYYDLDKYYKVAMVETRFWDRDGRLHIYDLGFSEDRQNYTSAQSDISGARVSKVEFNPNVRASTIFWNLKGTVLDGTPNVWNSITSIHIWVEEDYSEPLPTTEEPKPIPECPEGQKYNPETKKCEPIDQGGEEPKEPDQQIGELDDWGIPMQFPDLKVTKYGKINREVVNNFKSDGSMRHDFEGLVFSFIMMGYYIISGGPDKEELSPKIKGANHTASAPLNGRCYDWGINFAGDRLRMRIEWKHVDMSGNLVEQSLDLGNLRDKWVALAQVAINIMHKGKKAVKMITYFNKDPLTSDGKPKNDTWQKLYEVIDDGSLWGGSTPFLEPNSTEDAQNTIRIDAQDKKKFKYKFQQLREIKAVEGLEVLATK